MHHLLAGSYVGHFNSLAKPLLGIFGEARPSLHHGRDQHLLLVGVRLCALDRPHGKLSRTYLVKAPGTPGCRKRCQCPRHATLPSSQCPGSGTPRCTAAISTPECRAWHAPEPPHAARIQCRTDSGPRGCLSLRDLRRAALPERRERHREPALVVGIADKNGRLDEVPGGQALGVVGEDHLSVRHRGAKGAHPGLA